MAEKERVDAYLDTVNRLEPDIAHLDVSAAAASVAISLKRIADVLELSLARVHPPVTCIHGIYGKYVQGQDGRISMAFPDCPTCRGT